MWPATKHFAGQCAVQRRFNLQSAIFFYNCQHGGISPRIVGEFVDTFLRRLGIEVGLFARLRHNSRQLDCGNIQNIEHPFVSASIVVFRHRSLSCLPIFVIWLCSCDLTVSLPLLSLTVGLLHSVKVTCPHHSASF